MVSIIKDVVRTASLSACLPAERAPGLVDPTGKETTIATPGGVVRTREGCHSTAAEGLAENRPQTGQHGRIHRGRPTIDALIDSSATQ